MTVICQPDIYDLLAENARLKAENARLAETQDWQHPLNYDPRHWDEGPEEFLPAWLEQDCQCKAITHKGHQCTNVVRAWGNSWHGDSMPADYTPDSPDYNFCKQHKRLKAKGSA